MSTLLGLGNHGGFILAAYGLTLLVVAGLVGWILVDHREQKRALADLERRGIGRRSRPQGRGEAA
ncbi:MAG: heme exporter protein CcmD [Hyphomicrobiaceae bacterium]|nr:heme exporter protein CcmD [Hyphomicrobiaceae bacterium]